MSATTSIRTTTTKSKGTRAATADTKARATTEGVKVYVSRKGNGAQPDHKLLVAETREIYDEQLAAAIEEKLAAGAHYDAVVDQLEKMEQAANERVSAADDALDKLLAQMGGFAVVYKGLMYHAADHWDVFPARPVVVLKD